MTELEKKVGMKRPKHNGECDCGAEWDPHHPTCRGFGGEWTHLYARWAWANYQIP